jgi:O-acetyl-ADP-ribose deacetylase (regulator of RNase III)
MIEYRTGCVVEAFKTGQYFALLHQANCFNTMNSGVAKAIREEFPEAYAVDCKTQKGDPDKLGTYSYVGIDKLYGYIVNLYGQYTYGRDGRKYTLPAELETAMSAFARHFFLGGELGLAICLPRLGCGLGGASWQDEVLPMIERQLITRGFQVHVYDREGETCKSPNVPGITDSTRNFRAARSVIEHEAVSSQLAPTSALHCVA